MPKNRTIEAARIASGSSFRTLKKCVVASSLALIMSAMPAMAQDKVTLRIASFIPAQGFLNKAIIVPFLDKVVADSKGTLAYDFFPGGTLGRSPAQQLSLVQAGTVDMAVVLPAYTPGAFEAYNVTQLPGVAATAEASSVGAWRAFEAGLLPEPKGVKVLGIVTTASNILHTKQPVVTLADLVGLKIRAAGSIQASAIEKLGGAVIGNITGPEIAESLSRNLLDGTLMDWIGIKEFRVDRTAHNHLEADFGRLALLLPINQAKFDSLPEDAKAALIKNGGLAYAKAGGKAFDAAVDTFRADYLSQSKHSATKLTDADRATINTSFENVVNEWVAEDAGRKTLLNSFREGAKAVAK